MTVADWARTDYDRTIAAEPEPAGRRLFNWAVDVGAGIEFLQERERLRRLDWTPAEAAWLAAWWVSATYPEPAAERLRWGALRDLIAEHERTIQHLLDFDTIQQLGPDWVEEYQQRIAEGSVQATAARETVALAGRTMLRSKL